jgi:hypothetical protein
MFFQRLESTYGQRYAPTGKFVAYHLLKEILGWIERDVWKEAVTPGWNGASPYSSQMSAIAAAFGK